MSRDKRTQFPGAIYHVNARGNDGRPIYLDAYDKQHFVEGFTDAVDKDQIVVHAYCLMRNHWHGLIETPLGNIADALHRINWTHACRFNRRHGFKDHVFGTPYHDELIETDAHFLEVVRYIVLNPVRAGLCDLPEQWTWSSFSATAGLATCPEFLTVERVLGHMHPRLSIARARYVSFVHEGIRSSHADTSVYQVQRHGLDGHVRGDADGRIRQAA